MSKTEIAKVLREEIDVEHNSFKETDGKIRNRESLHRIKVFQEAIRIIRQSNVKPKKRASRRNRDRYARWLQSDSGVTFIEWLKTKWGKEA